MEPTARDSRPESQRSSSHRHLSRLTSRSRMSCPSMSCSPSIKHPYSGRSPHYLSRSHSTSYRHQVSQFSISKSQSNHIEGKHITDTTYDGHTSFHTTLQIITSLGNKYLPIKVNLGADVNTIPASRYCMLFLKHFTKACSLKQNTLQPTAHTWASHDNTPKHS